MIVAAFQRETTASFSRSSSTASLHSQVYSKGKKLKKKKKRTYTDHFLPDVSREETARKSSTAIDRGEPCVKSSADVQKNKRKTSPQTIEQQERVFAPVEQCLVRGYIYLNKK